MIRGYDIADVGKFPAVRLYSPKLDFHQPFESRIKEIDQCLETVRCLSRLAPELIIDWTEEIGNSLEKTDEEEIDVDEMQQKLDCYPAQ